MIACSIKLDCALFPLKKQKKVKCLILSPLFTLFMACAEKPLFNAYAGVFIGAIYLNLSLGLNLQSYSVYVSSDGSGETV